MNIHDIYINYLKYKNDRGKYIDAFYKLLCWNTANKRFMKDQY